MDQNKTCDADTLWKHTRQGFKREQQFNAAQDLLEAMDVVDILAHDLMIGHGTQLCPGNDCNIYYRSQEWRREQPFHSPMELPRTQYYCRCQSLRPGCSPTSMA
ncbi:hypothetical protein PHYSODRAFT_302858 [Phytophthora sojae]|uniref:Uncharacterized protein n=1 Tax=Phytophthora sojae (strain P6497) TaxID=1094619 RepID=G4ZT99_PHYSP|nr:hypothetical protein PHYSODRAFT_302858 [Phytophthora sojae]EGZ13131.1 hypothetical protein PHYSODRAFT_302858 [Phytophthora sojae]|eukprot:XP_009530560.1 hypothetical protein PHYSODRAFT_302858 [Phytophthora sojae]